MNNSFKIKKMVGIAVLLALIVVLQLISNYVTIGQVSITLALIPLTMGAILYGPIVGLFLGMVMGAVVLVAPSTSVYLNFNIWLTILLCLLKTGLAGLVSGLVYKGIIRLKFLGIAKFPVAIVFAALLAPIVNTGIFILGISTLFVGADLNGLVISSNFAESFSVLYSLVITINFLIEFLVSAILSPALVYLTKVLAHQNNMGFQNDFMLLDNTSKNETISNVNSEDLFK